MSQMRDGYDDDRSRSLLAALFCGLLTLRLPVSALMLWLGENGDIRQVNRPAARPLHADEIVAADLACVEQSEYPLCLKRLASHLQERYVPRPRSVPPSCSTKAQARGVPRVCAQACFADERGPSSLAGGAT
jgi:hypothetical protein